jgi:glycerol-3-phosphate O-acyltransferase
MPKKLPSSNNFPYVFSDIRDWPIYQLSRDRDSFMEVVRDATVQSIMSSRFKGSLTDEIAKVLYLERERIKESPWSVDPPDDDAFWRDIKKQLLKESLENETEEEIKASNEQIIRKIVERYVNEITGSFELSSYRFARKVLTILFNMMLNAAKLPFFGRNKQGETGNIKILGEIEHVRELCKKGTVVLVPTHFSNLDSILIGWSADRVGLPAFTYGAGLNLYNSKILAYFMRRLGAYTVDRRKKNSFYLETLKQYSKMSVFRGANSLFFPGGTRARSGQLETKLKLGLLGSLMDAQVDHYTTGQDTKIFVVPVVLNYHFVLEAKGLIEQYLANTGKELYLVEKKPLGGYRNIIKFIWKFLTTRSEIILNYGKPLDLMGNFVDTEGNSIDKFESQIDIKQYFTSDGNLQYDRQRNEQYTIMLAEKLVERYYAENIVLSSHLVSFTAFSLIAKRYPSLDTYGIMRLTPEETVIPYERFKTAIEALLARLLELTRQEKVKLSYQLIHGSTDDIIKHGVDNLGAFHSQKAFKFDKEGNLFSEDIHLLYYYHNRLEGYQLDKHIPTSKLLDDDY